MVEKVPRPHYRHMKTEPSRLSEIHPQRVAMRLRALRESVGLGLAVIMDDFSIAGLTVEDLSTIVRGTGR